jgi:protein tyrosine phosphatase (PTP) superfamily phosphohydrolase (DUF442 family)
MTLLAAAQGVVNAALPLPWLIVSGQPTAEQFAALHAGGVATVIDLRDSMEPRPLDEPTVVTALGMHYENVPVTLGALTDDAMARVIARLRAAAGTATLLHCNSANRTGGPLLAYLMLDHGYDESQAIDAAMRGGLRSAEVLEWATDYARRNS